MEAVKLKECSRCRDIFDRLSGYYRTTDRICRSCKDAVEAMERDKIAKKERDLKTAKDTLALALKALEYSCKITIRQVLYLAMTTGVVVDKKGGYNEVQRLMLDFRKSGQLSWDCVVDSRRDRSRITSFDSLEAYLDAIRGSFHTSEWSPAHGSMFWPELWVEKDTLQLVAEEALRKAGINDVPVQSMAGHASWTLKYELATDLCDVIGRGQYPVIGYIGDLDPSGVNIPEVIERDLNGFFGLKDIKVHRLGVLPEQIARYQMIKIPLILEGSNQNKSIKENYVKWLKEHGGEGVCYSSDRRKIWIAEADGIDPTPFVEIVNQFYGPYVKQNVDAKQRAVTLKNHVRDVIDRILDNTDVG